LSDYPDLSADEPVNPLPEVTVEQLPDRLREAVGRAGWPSLMPVQARAIPYLLDRRDMIVQARTGSGKTGAFLLPMLERLDPNLHKCQALVLVPTRELARQVAEDAELLCTEAGFRSVVVYGGVGYGEQIDALKGGAQIVIGTPGRVLDHLLKRNMSLEHLKLLVFDEADRMLSMGFYPDMKALQRYLPKRTFQACMFSATFPTYVLRTAREFIPEPTFLTLSRDQVHVTDIEHQYYVIPGMDKDRALVRIIELENPNSAIIFCNTKVRVHYVTAVLQRFGYDADEFSADLSQKDREQVLYRVRQGTLRFLVATDVAARGIDVPELSHVIQYEPPEDQEAYIHRAGRTGRAGATGVAIALVSAIEKLELNRIGKRYGINLQERPLPTDADVAEVVSQRVTLLLEARLRQRDSLHTERSKRFVPLARSLAESEEESAIVAMLLDDYYQETLHAPVAQPTGIPVRKAPPKQEPRKEPAAPKEPSTRAGRREKRAQRQTGTTEPAVAAEPTAAEAVAPNVDTEELRDALAITTPLPVTEPETLEPIAAAPTVDPIVAADEAPRPARNRGGRGRRRDREVGEPAVETAAEVASVVEEVPEAAPAPAPEPVVEAAPTPAPAPVVKGRWRPLRG
jgi:ATP-dependent RNA helicase DeaD